MSYDNSASAAPGAAASKDATPSGSRETDRPSLTGASDSLQQDGFDDLIDYDAEDMDIDVGPSITGEGQGEFEDGELLEEYDEVQPEESEVQPEESEVQPEESEVQPEESEVQPEESESQPEEGGQAQPGESSTVFTDFEFAKQLIARQGSGSALDLSDSLFRRDQQIEYGRMKESSKSDLDPEQPSFRFAPTTKTATYVVCAVDSTFSQQLSLDVKLVIDSGRFTATPFIRLDVERGRKYTATGVPEPTPERPYAVRFEYRPGVEVFDESGDQEGNIPMGDAEDTAGHADVNFEIKELEIFSLAELKSANPEQFQNIMKAEEYREGDESFNAVIYIRMIVHRGVYYDDQWLPADDTIIPNTERQMLKDMKLKTAEQELFFLFKNPSNAEWLSKIKVWWKELMDSRWPPMAHCLDFDSQPPVCNLTLESPHIHVIGNHLYAQYHTAEEKRCEREYWENSGNVKFPRTADGKFATIGVRNLEKQVHWHSGLHFECTYKLGIIAEHQFVIDEIERLILATHKVKVLSGVRLGDAGQQGSLTPTQERVRNSSYVFVWLARPKNGNRFIVPPVGTWMRMDPARGDPKSYKPSHKRGKWYGQVAECPLEQSKDLGADLCLYMTRPAMGRKLKEYQSMSDALAGAKEPVRLEPYYDLQTEKRQLAALGVATRTSTKSMHHITIPLLFTIERLQMPGQDFRVGKDNSDDVRNIWREVCEGIIDYRGLQDNPGHVRMMKMFDSLQGPVSLLTGAAGTGKTRLQADMLVLAMLGGYRVFVFARTQDAVDNMANTFQEAWDLAQEKFKGAPSVFARLSNKTFLRYESSGMPDREKIQCMADDLREGDENYTPAEAEETDWMNDPLAQRLLLMVQSKQHTDQSAMADEAKTEVTTALEFLTQG